MRDPAKARDSQRRYRERNREKLREADRRYREQNPERGRERLRRFRARRPSYFAEYAEANRERDRERQREAERRWVTANPNAKAETAARRRARQRAALVEAVDRDVILIRDAGICGICGDAVGPDWQLDHITPLSRGGEHSHRNTQPAHPLCNRRKGARLPTQLAIVR